MKLPSFLRKKPVDPEIKATYEAARREGRLERAKKEGYKAGATRPKSFLEKMADFGDALAKDIGSTGSGGGSSFDFLIGSEPKTRKKTRKKRKRRK